MPTNQTKTALQRRRRVSDVVCVDMRVFVYAQTWSCLICFPLVVYFLSVLLDEELVQDKEAAGEP